MNNIVSIWWKYDTHTQISSFEKFTRGANLAIIGDFLGINSMVGDIGGDDNDDSRLGQHLSCVGQHITYMSSDANDYFVGHVG